jgi:imidazoleglycerol-phosphate dehydratase
MSPSPRRASIERVTRETQVTVHLDLDGSGQYTLATGIGFFDHMLAQLAVHGRFDLTIQANGDRHVDGHHTIEDVGLALGQALRQALGDRVGIQRFGTAYVPLDEALTRVVVDLSNRPTLVWQVAIPVERIGNFESEMAREWFLAVANQAGMTLHVTTLHGSNGHHIVESCFKAFARALRDACAMDPRHAGQLPSSKGTLSQ